MSHKNLQTTFSNKLPTIGAFKERSPAIVHARCFCLYVLGFGDELPGLNFMARILFFAFCGTPFIPEKHSFDHKQNYERLGQLQLDML